MKGFFKKLRTFFIVGVLSFGLTVSNTAAVTYQATAIPVIYSALEVLVVILSLVGITIDAGNHAESQLESADELARAFENWRVLNGYGLGDSDADGKDDLIGTFNPLDYLQGEQLTIPEAEMQVWSEFVSSQLTFNGVCPSIDGVMDIVKSWKYYDEYNHEYILIKSAGQYYCVVADSFSYLPSDKDLLDIYAHQCTHKYNSKVYGFDVVDGKWNHCRSTGSPKSQYVAYFMYLADQPCEILYCSTDILDASGLYYFNELPYTFFSDFVLSSDDLSITGDYSVIGGGRTWDQDEQKVVGDISITMPSSQTISDYTDGVISQEDFLEVLDVTPVDVSTGTDILTGESLAPSIGIAEGVTSILQVLENIWDWLTSLIDSLIQALLNMLMSLFVPRDGFIEGEITKIKNKFNRLGVVPYDMSVIFDSDYQNPFQNITIYFNGQEVVIVSFDYLPPFLDKFRPIIRGLLVLFMIYYSINQLLGLIRLSGMMEGGNSNQLALQGSTVPQLEDKGGRR